LNTADFKRDWDALNRFIHANGGWTVSQPHVPVLRFECPLNAALPRLLIDAHYNARSTGPVERLMPASRLVPEAGRPKDEAKARDVIEPTLVERREVEVPCAS
jgi:hypothetical protein